MVAGIKHLCPTDEGAGHSGEGWLGSNDHSPDVSPVLHLLLCLVRSVRFQGYQSPIESLSRSLSSLLHRTGRGEIPTGNDCMVGMRS